MNSKPLSSKLPLQQFTGLNQKGEKTQKPTVHKIKVRSAK